jgi:hypothetical protein
MALPTFRFPSSPAKDGKTQAEPDEQQKKAALKRRTAEAKPSADENVVNDRKKAGY